jgi:hypothetical protein
MKENVQKIFIVEIFALYLTADEHKRSSSSLTAIIRQVEE